MVEPGSLLELLHLPACFVDAEGRVLAANERLERILGLPHGLLSGRQLRAIYRDPSDRSTLDFLLSHPMDLAGENDREEEFYLPTPSGSRVPTLVNVSRLPEPPGSLLVTFVDISKRKEAETNLREHFVYVSQLSDTALEQALALKRQNTEAQAEARELREQTTELEVVNRELERRVAQRTAEIRQANLDAIYMLAVASEAKDHDTGAHVRRIRGLSEKLARALGFSESDAYEIGLAAILHDVGKIHVPDAILGKPGPLTPDERKVMEQHTLWGQRIMPDRPFFQRARLIARSHHEQVDGTGYPDNLAGDAIPIEARIVHVADVYDALVSPRVYKKAWPREAALSEIATHIGTHYDPEVVKAMRSLSDVQEGT